MNTAQLASIICIALTGLCGSSSAADFYDYEVLGFSKSGQYFAFEEYGTSEGHGAPFSSLFFVDVEKNKWLKGSPVRLRGSEDEGHALENKASKLSGKDAYQRVSEVALAQKRKEARSTAANLFVATGGFSSGQQVYKQVPFDFTHSGRNIRFSTTGYTRRLTSTVEKKVWSITLEQQTFPAGENCYGMFEDTKGFSLTLINEKTGAEYVLNKDIRVPKSRGCPQGYAVEEVQIKNLGSNSMVVAVIIRYSQIGFEGLSGRIMSVTGRVDK